MRFAAVMTMHRSPLAGALQQVELPQASDAPGTPSVRIWRVEPEDVDTPLAQLVEVLDPAERAQVRQRRSEQARRMYAVSHASLRVILAAELGIAAEEVSYGRPRHLRGKPVLENDRRLGFNLSHTRGLAVVALTRNGEIGVDVEWLGRRPNHEALARRFLTAPELAELTAAPDERKRWCFLRLWTRREAHAKMTGEGVRRAMARGTGSGGPFGGKPSRILDVDLPPSHLGAIAVPA